MIVSVIMIIYSVSNYSHLLHQSSSWSYSWWSTQTQTSETRTTIKTFQSTLTLINIMKHLPTTMIKNLTMSNVNKCFILVISNKNNKSFSYFYYNQDKKTMILASSPCQSNLNLTLKTVSYKSSSCINTICYNRKLAAVM